MCTGQAEVVEQLRRLEGTYQGGSVTLVWRCVLKSLRPGFESWQSFTSNVTLSKFSTSLRLRFFHNGDNEMPISLCYWRIKCRQIICVVPDGWMLS